MDRNKTIKLLFIILAGIIVFVLVSRILKNSVSNELEDVKVVLTGKVLKDDVFQLLYWEGAEKKFKIENSVRTEIKGSTGFQKIVFELPTLSDLYRLRLDIGENSHQEKITIQKIEFHSAEGDSEFQADQFDKLFAPNKFVKITGEGEYMGMSGTSGERSFYDPYFVSIEGSKEMELIKGNGSDLYAYLAGILTSIILMIFMLRNLEKITISRKGAFVYAFMLIIIVPNLQQKIGFVEGLENLEKRELAAKPGFSFSKKFVKDFEAYFDDNFGFRNRLVSWGATIKTNIFRSSKNPDLVMFGKDKWLFYNRRIGNSRMFDSYTRTKLLTTDTLKLLVDNWEKRKWEYEAKGRKYLLVFWPNKHSIYPEKMSAIMKMQIKDTFSRTDQILKYLKDTNSSINLIDVRQKLLNEKSNRQVYHKFDSHWNDYGAFLAYQDFFRQNESILGKPKTIEEFDIKWENYYGGELIQLLGVRNKGFFQEQRPTLTLKKDKERIQYLPTEGYPKLTVRTKNERAGNRLKVLIFRDSFTNSLEQFFSLHFFEVTYIWQNHNPYYVKKLQPNIIIDGFVEREIGNKIQ